MLLFLELKASKLEVSSLYARARKDREDMVEDYQRSLDLIFSYGYGCFGFKNNICGDQSEILDGMTDSANPLPPKKFDKPRCPPAPLAVEAKDTKVNQGEAIEGSERGLVTKD